MFGGTAPTEFVHCFTKALLQTRMICWIFFCYVIVRSCLVKNAAQKKNKHTTKHTLKKGNGIYPLDSPAKDFYPIHSLISRSSPKAHLYHPLEFNSMYTSLKGLMIHMFKLSGLQSACQRQLEWRYRLNSSLAQQRNPVALGQTLPFSPKESTGICIHKKYKNSPGKKILTSHKTQILTFVNCYNFSSVFIRMSKYY